MIALIMSILMSLHPIDPEYSIRTAEYGFDINGNPYCKLPDHVTDYSCEWCIDGKMTYVSFWYINGRWYTLVTKGDC